MSIDKETTLKYLDVIMRDTDDYDSFSLNNNLMRTQEFDTISNYGRAYFLELSEAVMKEGVKLRYFVNLDKQFTYFKFTNFGEEVHYAGGHFSYTKEKGDKKPWNFYTTWISIGLVIVFGVFSAWQNNDRKNLKAKIETLEYDKANLERVNEVLESRNEMLTKNDTLK